MGNACAGCCGDANDPLHLPLDTVEGGDEGLAQLFKPEMADILHEGVSVGLILQVNNTNNAFAFLLGAVAAHGREM